jgi:hypothetical protein
MPVLAEKKAAMEQMHGVLYIFLFCEERYQCMKEPDESFSSKPTHA